MPEEDQVFQYWQQVMQKERARMDTKRRNAIRDRLRDGYTLEDLMDAVTGCRLSRFHMGENDRHTAYNDIALICRDAVHLDMFIEVFERSKAKVPKADNVVPIDREAGRDRLAELKQILRRA